MVWSWICNSSCQTSAANQLCDFFAKENIIFPLPNFKTKKIVHKNQVFKLISEIPLAPNYLLLLSNKEQNINIENQYHSLVLDSLRVQVCNKLTLREEQSLNIVVKLKQQSYGDFLSPYKVFFNFHTWDSFPCTTNPSVCCM